jgi:hypothetical protein
VTNRHCSTLTWFRKHLRIPVGALLLMTFSLWSVQVRGATFAWDGGSGIWDAGTTVRWNTGDFWNEGNNAQALTLTSTGEMVLTGNITATTNFASVNKTGTGSFTIQGTAGTFNGSATVTQGGLNISSSGALNASSTGSRCFCLAVLATTHH